MKNIASILKLIVFVGVIIFAKDALATTPPPSPTCKIEGEIISSVFKEASEHPCVSEGSCPTDTPLRFPARQEIKIKISEVSYVEGDASVMKCGDMHQIGNVGGYWILKENIVEGDKFTSDKLINARIDGGRIGLNSGGYISTYTLKLKEKITNSTDTTVSTIIEPSKISEKITTDQTVDSVKSITLSDDKKKYVMEAVKTGKLFSLFEVDVHIKITIDALTGEVYEIDKPWWSFLVTF